MSETILIGTRGWDHADWLGGFYPAELPVEWRFCYYSNLLRAVLVPAEVWSNATPSAVAQWAEDSDAGFRFVLEPPPLASVVELAAFLRLIEPIASQTDGFLVSAVPTVPQPSPHPSPTIAGEGESVEDDGWDRFDMLLAGLTRVHPVCVDVPVGEPSPELSALFAAHRVGRCWHATPGMDDSREGGGTTPWMVEVESCREQGPRTASGTAVEEVEPRRATPRMAEVEQRREQLPERRPSAPNGAPAPGGALLVALSEGGLAPELRRTLEALARWQEQGGRAALFFDGPGAADAARTARTLAELMGV